VINCNSEFDCQVSREAGQFVKPGLDTPMCKKNVVGSPVILQGATCAIDEDCGAGYICINNTCISSCFLDEDCAGGEICLAGQCHETTGTCYTDLGTNGDLQTIDKSCRGYPEEDSPISYDEEIVRYQSDPNEEGFGDVLYKDPELENANIGFTANYETDCSYQKVQYKTAKKCISIKTTVFKFI